MGLKGKDYRKLLEPMTEELVGMARWARTTGARIVVLFEGRDTAGKGGAIRAVRDKLNPRQCRTVALSKPSEDEQTQWYFQRYIDHLPSAGEIVLFDRSWYNRAGVEKVMGYATGAQVDAFLKQAPIFEKQLTDDGILLFKYWLTTDQDRQEERLRERLEDPLKRWKLSPVDLAARDKYDAYTEAREAMLKATSTDNAPWTLVNFNDQKRGRLSLIRDLLDRLPDTHIEPPAIDFPDLHREPKSESYSVMKPIRDYPIKS
ncbi:polyphosphate kinase 2 [Erythrobacter crassostreae]|uniref:ADP/GDP-polyphosphate phosphotransferase n=1 Tax=Erythrobacter crassostreae TaxID=2828328 RepID=A0A9X1F4R1_9SPHN|nr:polyphosphate kinase 2 [Erythrobacter crassostrea]MBV7258770.1 polyphosphate kinase 2 [Erythrobacter crassostrea]